MTQNLDRVDLPVGLGTPPAPARAWWRRPWIAPLFFFSLLYISGTAMPYLNKETAPLMPHDGFPAYYSILMTHIAVATVALLTSIFQVWPWLRRTHPAVHRWGGRLYVVTTLVAGVLGLIIVPFAPPSGRVGVTVATVLWLAFMAVLVVYLEATNSFGATYGPIAGTIGILLWTFLSSVALFLGLAFAAQLEAIRAGVAITRREDDERTADAPTA